MNPEDIKKKKDLDYAKKIFNKQNQFIITKKHNETKDSFTEDVEHIIEVTKKYGIISDKIKMLEQQIDECLKEDNLVNRAKFFKITAQLSKLKKEVKAS